MKSKKFSPVVLLLVKWSGIALTDGRGKVGGSVLSKSRAGATVRNKVTGVNRKSPAQSLRRAVFGSLSQMWRTLTQVQRNAWIALANTAFTSTNIFGDVVRKTGNALFIALNANLNLVEVAPISNAPSSSDVGAGVFELNCASDVSASTIYLNCKFEAGAEDVPADNCLAYYATPKLSPGVQFVGSQLRFIGFLGEGDDTTAVNVYGLYVSSYGPPAVGDNIVFAVHCINKLSGAASVPVQSVLTIAA